MTGTDSDLHRELDKMSELLLQMTESTPPSGFQIPHIEQAVRQARSSATFNDDVAPWVRRQSRSSPSLPDLIETNPAKVPAVTARHTNEPRSQRKLERPPAQEPVCEPATTEAGPALGERPAAIADHDPESQSSVDGHPPAEGVRRIGELPEDVGGGRDTELDRLILATCMRTHNRAAGAPTPQQLRAVISELVDLQPDRAGSWFAAGYASGLGLAKRDWLTSHPALNRSLRAQRMSGALHGVLVARPEMLVDELDNRVDDICEAFGLAHAQEVRDALLTACLASNPKWALELVRRSPIGDLAAEISLFESVLDQVAIMLDTDSIDIAHDLCAALLERAGGTERPGRHAPISASPLSDQRVRAAVALCYADRLRGRWEHARRHLDEIPDLELAAATDETRSSVLLGVACATARIGGAMSVDPVRDGAAARLVAIEAELREVVAAGSLHPEADYLLACLELSRGAQAVAAELFDRAAQAFAGRPQGSAMRARCELHSARLHLQTGAGEDPTATAASSLMRAMRSGEQLSATDLEDVLEGLLCRDAPQVVDLVSLIAEPGYHGRLPASVLSEAIRSFPELAASAVPLSRRVPVRDRITLLGVAAETAAGVGDDKLLPTLLDAIDETLWSNGGWVRWSQILTDSENLRCYLDNDGGVVADLMAASALLHAGCGPSETASYIRILERLMHRRFRSVDVTALVLALQDIADPQVFQAYRDRLIGMDLMSPQGDARAGLPALNWAEQPARGTPSATRVCFVGGSDAERKDAARVPAILVEHGYEWVDVAWHHPGWGANWTSEADRVEAEYPRSRAVVLMPLVRTNFGRRIRRSCGEHGLPWVSCTGRGSHAMARAIERAAQIAIDPAI